MKKLNQTFLLFMVIIIEGYVVLSSELLVIRQTISFIGSGTDTVSIIIAAVLMPLAVGYQRGGMFKPHRFMGMHFGYREKLIFNLVVATWILLPGLSYIFMELFFPALSEAGITNRLAQITIYCCLFLVIPVYLLGQTIPLISNYFSQEKLSEITGRMLFFSTMGSFLGAVFSVLVLMAFLGVHHTVSINFALLAFLVFLLSKKKTSEPVLIMLGAMIIAFFINSNDVMATLNIVNNNQYNTAKVAVTSDARHLFLNGNSSSKYGRYGRKHPYVEFAEKLSIDPILDSEEPKDVLIIGAGGFTFGHEDMNNTYFYVDIDPDLKKIAEEHILKEPIGENKTFYPEPARAFLSRMENKGQKFDVVFLDAYLGGLTIPEHLVTVEFFEQIRNSMNDGAILITNFIASPNFANKFSRSIDNTLRAAMPHVSRVVMQDYYFLYNDNPNVLINVTYIYRHETDYDQGVIYTDDKNTVYYDKPKKLEGIEESDLQ